MADHSQSMSYNAGEAKGQAEVKKDQMVDKASGAMQSAKESCQQLAQVGQQILGACGDSNRTGYLQMHSKGFEGGHGDNLNAGQQMKEKAQGAADTVKEATGMKK